MKRRQTTISVFALTAATLGGCGSDTKPMAGGHDAGGPVGRPSDQQCLRPQDLTEVLAPGVLGGSSITQLIADGSNVYFSIGTSLYRVPAQGGQAEEIFADT